MNEDEKADNRITLPSNYKEAITEDDKCIDGHLDVFEDIDGDDDTEIWLIRTPSGLDPSELNGHTISLDGPTKLKIKKSNTRYTMTLEDNISDQLKSNVVLLPDSSSKKYKPVEKSIEGCVTVSLAVKTQPITYPASVPNHPTFPEGLKVRYTPFGSEEPVQLKSSSKKRKKSEKRKLATKTETELLNDAVSEQVSQPESDQDIFSPTNTDKSESKKQKKNKRK